MTVRQVFHRGGFYRIIRQFLGELAVRPQAPLVIDNEVARYRKEPGTSVFHLAEGTALTERTEKQIVQEVVTITGVGHALQLAAQKPPQFCLGGLPSPQRMGRASAGLSIALALSWIIYAPRTAPTACRVYPWQ